MASETAAPQEKDPTVVAHRTLEAMALVALRAGRVLMESGARAKVVDDYTARLARALGAQTAEVRSGYASLTITVSHGVNTITRMVTVGRHGVNTRLDHGLRVLIHRIEEQRPTMAEAQAQIETLVKTTPHHPLWLISIFVGIACAAFGRLLGIDWAAVLPVFVAAGFGQWVRGNLMRRGVNVFIVAAVIAFISSALGGFGARFFGSATVDVASVASTLLLVPGIPAINAQSDILEGRPTMGSARAVTVMMILVFAATGIIAAASLLKAVHWP